MGIQNLRNKYERHPVIKPIIDYCRENELIFELVKETRLIGYGNFKSFNHLSTYYMIIGDEKIQYDSKLWYWDSLFKLILKAYEHLDIEYPDNLTRAIKVFRS